MSTSNYFGGRRAKRPGEGRPRRLEIRTAGRLFSKQNPSQAVSASLAAIGNNGGLANAVWRRFAAKRRSRFIDADSVRATPRRLVGAEPGAEPGLSAGRLHDRIGSWWESGRFLSVSSRHDDIPPRPDRALPSVLPTGWGASIEGIDPGSLDHRIVPLAVSPVLGQNP